MSVIYGNIVGGAGSNGSGVETINGIVTSTNAVYAEVGEWSDGNPDGEDRIGYFVAVDTSEPGKTMIKATTDSDVRGVTISKPAFAANASKDKYDSDGNLLPQFDYVCFAGFASIIDNGLCSVNGRCMPSADGTAEPSTNDFGYQVIERIDDTKILVLVEPQADMTARIKDDISTLSDEIANKGNPTDEQVSNAVTEYLKENPVEAQDGQMEIINNPISDIIATAVANAYTGNLTHKVIDDSSVVYNGGMLCNDPPAAGVMIGETKFNASGDGRTEDSGTVNVRWVTISNTFGKNDFSFTSGDDVEIFAPGGSITRVDGTTAAATTGGFGDQILHDTANNKYIVIAEAFVGSENVVFACVTTAESNDAKPAMEFTAPQELTLTVDGVAYNIQNGLLAINSDYDSVSQYNGDIAYIGGLFYWVLTNNYKGWIVLTSSDGQNWAFNRYIVPDNGAENLFIEAAIGYNTNTNTMLIAGRTKTETGYMVLTAYQVSSGAQCTKLIPDCRIGSKPSIAQHGYGYYVGHNIGNRADYELLFVNTYYAAASTKIQTMDIWRVNAWHGVSTQYATIRLGKQASHYGYIGLSGTAGYAHLLHCYGMDGNQFNKNGSSFTYDAFDVYALTLKNGNQARLENAYYQKGLLANGITVDDALSEESTNPVQNAVVTEALSKKVGASGWTADKYLGTDSDGNVVEKDAPSGSSGSSSVSDAFELISEVTVEDGSTYVTVPLTKNYKRFFIKLNSVTTSATTTARLCINGTTASATNTIGATSTNQLTTSEYRYIWIDAERIVDGVWKTTTTNAGGNMVVSAAYAYHHGGVGLLAGKDFTSISLVIQTTDVTFTGGTIYFYGIPA